MPLSPGILRIGLLYALVGVPGLGCDRRSDPPDDDASGADDDTSGDDDDAPELANQEPLPEECLW